MTEPPQIPHSNDFVRRHLVAFGVTIVGFTIICVVVYVACIVFSNSGFGSPAMPFLVPIFAVFFSLIYTLTVVLPSCAIGEMLFARHLHLAWYFHFLGTCVLFGAWLWVGIVIFDWFVPRRIVGLPTIVRVFAFLIPFVIYWPISRRALL